MVLVKQNYFLAEFMITGLDCTRFSRGFVWTFDRCFC